MTEIATPPPVATLRRIKRFAPLQLGKMLAVLYGAMGLLFCPIFLVMSLVTQHAQQGPGSALMFLGTGFALMMPFFYAAMGFVAGVVGGFIYNQIARWIGGIEVEVE